MPTYQRLPRFDKDWDELTEAQKQCFRRAVAALVDDLSAGRPFRKGLSVKRVQAASGVWEMTFAPDGRATWSYGAEVTRANRMSCGAASARTTSSTVPDACGSTSGCGLADEPVPRRPLPSSSPVLPHGVLGIGRGRRRTLHRGAAVVLLQQLVEDLHTRSRADRPAAHLAVGVKPCSNGTSSQP